MSGLSFEGELGKSVTHERPPRARIDSMIGIMQRLSGLDASFLYFETRSQLLHVCGLIRVDPSTVKGGYGYEKMRRELSRRVKGMPGFRRKLHDSLMNVDHPVWVEATDFDIDHHLHRIAVPAPGGDVELSELTAHLAGQPMDRSMPLWEMWVIEGLADGSVAVFAKMHHSTVDGVTGTNMMSQLCTLSPEAPELDKTLVQMNAGGTNVVELALGGAMAYAARPLKFLSLLPSTLVLLPKWVRRSLKGEAMPAPFTAPRTSFNGTITGHRSISFIGLNLDDVKVVKNAFGTKLNDVVLAICAGALREYLENRNELPDSSLVAMVPVSVHGAMDRRPGTNRVSGMFAKLATDIADPVERLLSIRDSNRVSKEHKDAIDANLLTDWAQFAAPSVFGSAVRMYSHLRLAERHPVVHNLVISNVPGPDFPLYFLGAKITGMFPLGPVFHGAGLNVTVMSLDKQLHIGFIACKELAPDLWPLAEGAKHALAELVERARSMTPEQREAVLTVEDSARDLRAAQLQERREDKYATSRRPDTTRQAANGKATTRKVAGKRSAAAKTPVLDSEVSMGTEVISVVDSASSSVVGDRATDAPAKKATARKSTAKKSTAKKATATKATAKKVPEKKSTVKNGTARQVPAKSPTAKKATAVKVTARKTTVRKTAQRKTPANKIAATDISAATALPSELIATKTAPSAPIRP